MADARKVSVLFVCMGNICRSPTAEGVMRKHLEGLTEELSVEVDSAGTHAYHAGQAPDPRAIEAAARRGIDLSGQIARAVEHADFERFDLILAMDEDNLAILENMRPPGSRSQVGLLLAYSRSYPVGSVPDPYYGGRNGFERVLDMLEDACAGLLQHLQKP